MTDVLRHCWHPVCWAGDLGSGPLGTQLLDQRIVVWRDAQGIPRAGSEQCPHRGTALSLGTVDDEGCLVCPYHGWTYATSGHCIAIPQQDADSPIPARARIDTFHCAERSGLVWVSLEDPIAGIPAFPEWDDPGYRHVACDPYTWQCGAGRMVENFTDFGHLGYLHDGLLGTKDDLVVPTHRVTTDQSELHYELTMVVPNTNEEFAVTDVEGTRGLQTNTYVLSLPYSIHLQCRYHDTGANRTLFFAVQPRSAHESTGYCYQSRDFDLAADPAPFAEFQAVLSEQDRPIVESQRPKEIPLTLSDELHLSFDKVAIAYRRALSAFLSADGTGLFTDQLSLSVQIEPDEAVRGVP